MSAVPALAAARPAPLDAVDRAIVLETQAGLPLTPAPYQAVADAVGAGGGSAGAVALPVFPEARNSSTANGTSAL